MLELKVIGLQTVIGCVFFVSCAAVSRGDDSFTKEVKAVAESMAEFLTSENFSKIAIKKFEGPSSFPASAGPGIAEILVSHFKMKGFEVVGVSRKADVAVSGKYRLDPGADNAFRPKLVELVVSFTLEDEFGNPFPKYGDQGTVDVRSDDASRIAGTIGVTAEWDKTLGSLEARKLKDHQVLLQAYKNPKADIANGNEVKRPDSPYGMQVLVDGRPKPIEEQYGLAFCNLAQGDEFELLLRNDSDYDAAVELKLDGISTFRFSRLRSPTGEPLYVHYIVPKKSRSLVAGWHVNNNEVKKYKITGFEGSAAMEANQDVGIGTIIASFSAAWEHDEKAPEGELVTRGSGKDGEFIGFGDPKQFSVTAVPRKIGDVRETLSLRYKKPAVTTLDLKDQIPK